MASAAAAVWSVLLAAAAPGDRADHVIRPATEQQPLVLVVNSPSRQLVGLRLSEIIALADEAARRTSDFDVVELDVGACLEPSRAAELFFCLSEAALNSYANSPRYLMVLSIRGTGEGDRVVTSLVDLEEAVRFTHRDRPVEEQEARIIDDAIAVNVAPEVVSSPGELRAYLQRAFEVSFRETFERSGHWRPFGTIEIRAEVPNAAIRLDDREIGKTAGGLTRLEGIKSGRRKIALSHPEFEPVEQEVDVQPGESARVDASLIPLPRPVVTYSRTAVIVLGAASSIAGGSLLIYAAAKPKRSAVCIELHDGACEGGVEPARFGDSEGRLSSPNGGGAPIAGIGAGLLGMGATWSLGTWLFDSGDRMPWYEIAAGIVVFGASVGISYALVGRNSVEALAN